MAETDIDESLLRAKCARQTRLRLEPEVQRDDIDIVSAVQPAAGDLCGPHAIVAVQCRPPAPTRAPARRHASASAACRCPRASGRARCEPWSRPSRQAAGPGRGAASTTANGFTPPASSSQASCRLSGPLPAISTRSPGQTRCARTSVCSAPVVITPGRVQPGNGTGRSCAPVASTSRRGSERHRAASDQGGDLVDRKGAPRQWRRTRSARRRQTARSRSALPRRNCASGAASAWLSASGLAYWPPGAAAFVQHHDGCSGLALRRWPRTARPDRRRPPARRTPAPRPARPPVRCAERRQWQGRLAGDRHAVGHLGHARALADAAIHRHHTVETGAHAAMQPARCAAGGAAERDDAGGRQRGGDGLAFQCRDRKAVELERDGAADAADRLVGKAHDAPA